MAEEINAESGRVDKKKRKEKNAHNANCCRNKVKFR